MIRCSDVFYDGTRYTMLFNHITGARKFYCVLEKNILASIDSKREAQLQQRYSKVTLASHFRSEESDFDPWSEGSMRRQKRRKQQARRKFCLIAGLTVVIAGTSIWGVGKYFSLKKDLPYETMSDPSDKIGSSSEKSPSSEDEMDELEQLEKEFLEQEQARIASIPFQFEDQIQKIESQGSQSYYERAEKSLLANSNETFLGEQSLENLKDMIGYYGKYFDWEDVSLRLQLVDVIYGKENFVDKPRAVAAYYSGVNIYIPEDTAEQFLEEKNATQAFDHEFTHLLSCCGFIKQYDSFNEYLSLQEREDLPDFDYNKLGSCLTEGMTQQLMVEFSKDLLSRYKVERNYSNAITEIVGAECMAKTYWAHDLDGLIEELQKYIGEIKTYQLLVNLDTVNQNNLLLASFDIKEKEGEKLSAEDSQIKQDLEMTNLVTNQQIWQVMEELYLEKTGLSMEEDLLMCAYRSATTGEALDSIHYLSDNKTTVDVETAYFSPRYMEELRAPKINYYYEQLIDIGETIEMKNGNIVKTVSTTNYAVEYVTEENRYKSSPAKQAVKVK